MNIALILSGGIGTRIGSSIPKQYIAVAGKPIIAYCMDGEDMKAYYQYTDDGAGRRASFFVWFQ